MAYRYEGGIDIETPLAILGQGIEKYALLKRQEKQVAEARVDDFLKMYQPGKLRTMDIPDFTTAYNNYKNAALSYTKLNRGGGRTEELAASKANMDAAMANLNSIYSNSVAAVEKQKEYADYQVIARQKGYDVPDEIKMNYNLLSSSPIGSLKVQDMPSAYSYDMVSKSIDMDNFKKFMGTVGATPKQVKEFVNQREETFAGNKVKARDIRTYTAIPLETAIKAVGMYGQVGAKAAERNAFNTTMAKYKSAFDISDDTNKSAIVERLKPIYPNITKDDVTGQMLFGLELSTPEQVSIVGDDKYYSKQIDEIKFKQKVSTDERKIRASENKGKDKSQEETKYADLMGQINGLFDSNPNVPMISVSNIDINGQGTIADIVKKASGGENIQANKMYLKRNQDGTVRIFTAEPITEIGKDYQEKTIFAKDQEIGTLSGSNINVSASQGAQEKAAARAKTPAKAQPKQKSAVGKKYYGLDASGKPIIK